MGLLGSSHFMRVRELFSDQFEPDGVDFVYRKGLKGAAIRVTRAERDQFISAFYRKIRFATWLIIPATFILIAALVVFVPNADGSQAQLASLAGVALIIAIFLPSYLWAWNAPARELERRPSESGPLTREKVRQVMYARMTYGQLAIAAASGPLLVWKVSAKNDVLHGWGVLWLAFAGLLILGAVVQAVRKWLFERKRLPHP